VVSSIAVALAAASGFARDIESSDPSGAKTGAMGQMGIHMEMGPHMTMTDARPASAEDLERARRLLAALREALRKYDDYLEGPDYFAARETTSSPSSVDSAWRQMAPVFGPPKRPPAIDT
jgi:hypothetical protein